MKWQDLVSFSNWYNGKWPLAAGLLLGSAPGDLIGPYNKDSSRYFGATFSLKF